MAIDRTQRTQMTDYEREGFEQEKTVTQMQLEHVQALKAMDYEISKIEAKWTIVFKLPLAIVTLPVKVLMAVGYIVAMARKQEPSDKFWEYLKWKS